MGISDGFYVGVYIKVPVKSFDIPVASKATCSKDHKHPVEVDHKFCPDCGSAINIEYKNKRKVEVVLPWDEPFECDNDFWVPESHSRADGYTIWLINSHNDRSRLIFDEGPVKITPEFISFAIVEFRLRYSVLLEKLNKHTNCGIVVEFGAVKYWH